MILRFISWYAIWLQKYGSFIENILVFRNILVAACENNSLVLIDPLSNEIIYKKENAHSLRCNTISFIDERLFATCSDDSNVSVWDIRNMKEVRFCLFFFYTF